MRNYIRVSFGVGFLLIFGVSHAGIALDSTRIVFEGKNKEENITVINEGNGQILLQSWLDGGETSEGVSIPFAVTPQLAKMAGKGRQLLRVLFKGTGLPQDRESVVWLNVQEIPQKSGHTNSLQIAIRQRIKVFYRPEGIVGDASDAASNLQWQLGKAGTDLSVYNPSNYHVSMLQLKLGSVGQEVLIRERKMLAPGERLVISLEKDIKAVSGMSLTFRSINDWGGQESYNVVLSNSSTSIATLAGK